MTRNLVLFPKINKYHISFAIVKTKNPLNDMVDRLTTKQKKKWNNSLKKLNKITEKW